MQEGLRCPSDSFKTLDKTQLDRIWNCALDTQNKNRTTDPPDIDDCFDDSSNKALAFRDYDRELTLLELADRF